MGKLKEYGCGMSDKTIKIEEPCDGCDARDYEIKTLKGLVRKFEELQDAAQDRVHYYADKCDYLEELLEAKGIDYV